MNKATKPQPTGFRVNTGMVISLAEMDEYASDPSNIEFERNEVLHFTDGMIAAIHGEKPWFAFRPRRLQEAIEMLSLMAYDEGRVNQDAEF